MNKEIKKDKNGFSCDMFLNKSNSRSDYNWMKCWIRRKPINRIPIHKIVRTPDLLQQLLHPVFEAIKDENEKYIEVKLDMEAVKEIVDNFNILHKSRIDLKYIHYYIMKLINLFLRTYTNTNYEVMLNHTTYDDIFIAKLRLAKDIELTKNGIYFWETFLGNFMVSYYKKYKLSNNPIIRKRFGYFYVKETIEKLTEEAKSFLYGKNITTYLEFISQTKIDLNKLRTEFYNMYFKPKQKSLFDEAVIIDCKEYKLITDSYTKNKTMFPNDVYFYKQDIRKDSENNLVEITKQKHNIDNKQIIHTIHKRKPTLKSFDLDYYETNRVILNELMYAQVDHILTNYNKRFNLENITLKLFRTKDGEVIPLLIPRIKGFHSNYKDNKTFTKHKSEKIPLFTSANAKLNMIIIHMFGTSQQRICQLNNESLDVETRIFSLVYDLYINTMNKMIYILHHNKYISDDMFNKLYNNIVFEQKGFKYSKHDSLYFFDTYSKQVSKLENKILVKLRKSCKDAGFKIPKNIEEV